MNFQPVTITLKNGKTAILRPATEQDAEGLLCFLRTLCTETPFVLRTAEEANAITLESEVGWIRSMNADPRKFLLVCEIDGEIAGNCELSFGSSAKVCHRAIVGIGLKKKYWGLGIGTSMFVELEREARRHAGVQYMDLEMLDGNVRARGLYEKMGFRTIAVMPGFFCQDGQPVNGYWMRKEL